MHAFPGDFPLKWPGKFHIHISVKIEECAIRDLLNKVYPKE